MGFKRKIIALTLTFLVLFSEVAMANTFTIKSSIYDNTPWETYIAATGNFSFTSGSDYIIINNLNVGPYIYWAKQGNYEGNVYNWLIGTHSFNLGGTYSVQTISPYINRAEYTQFPNIVATNLSPNRPYSLNLSTRDLVSGGDHYYQGQVVYAPRISSIYIDNYLFGSYPITYGENVVYTKPATPIISFSNIKDNRLNININSNGNPSNTRFNIQRSTDGVVWEDVVTTTSLEYIDIGLINETLYKYRVIALGNGTGSNYFTTSSLIIEVETTANPAVAAAQEAASRAKATQETSEVILTQINHEEYGLQVLNTKIDALNTPVIQKVYASNAATAVKNISISPPIEVTAIGATHFQLSLDSANWGTPIIVTEPGYIELKLGFNNVKVRAFNENIPADKRNYARGNIVLFRL